MTESHSLPRVYPSAREGLEQAQQQIDMPQTRSPAYRLAFADNEFLTTDDTRAVRLQLEWQKFDLLLERAGIEHTMVLFGGARIVSAKEANARVTSLQEKCAAEPDNAALAHALQQAKNLLNKAQYYDDAQQLAFRIANESQQAFGFPSTVMTGGGPGIMEAANRGAFEAGKPSIGLNIVLPKEQHPNPFITPEFCFQFHYFAVRKMHFLMRARAIIVFPGGYGTMDELFETLTLLQTGRITPLPIVLYGETYWRQIINFELMVEEGVISHDDLCLFRYANSVDEAFDHIRDFYSSHPLEPPDDQRT